VKIIIGVATTINTNTMNRTMSGGVAASWIPMLKGARCKSIQLKRITSKLTMATCKIYNKFDAHAAKKLAIKLTNAKVIQTTAKDSLN